MATALRVTSALRMAARSGTQVRSMATGTVKWFNEKKGFGFITPDESGDSDLFVHHSVVQSKGFRFLVEGEKVTYDKGQGDKGPQAMNVTDETGKPFVRPQRRFGDGEGAPRRERRPREDREYQ